MNKGNNIADSFEESFLSVSLEQQIKNCDHYELSDYFMQYLYKYQPILEAGCGSGRWVGWFIKNNLRATGVDWSETLCNEAQKAIPEGEFIASDIADMPFENKTFCSIIALGSIEHTECGPLKILQEFNRVLHDDGIAIITVPYLSIVRIIRRFVRCLLGKKDEKYIKAPLLYSGKWAADYHYENENWSFFQYLFNKKQMRMLLKEAGFRIEAEFVDFKDEGIFHNFGHVTGEYNHNTGSVIFNNTGKLLKFLLPLRATGHMLCYKVKKVTS